MSWLVKGPIMVYWVVFAGLAWFIEQAESLREWKG